MLDSAGSSSSTPGSPTGSLAPPESGARGEAVRPRPALVRDLGADSPLFVSAARLALFRDELCVRDPRGRSLRPSLAAVSVRGEQVLQVRGPFSVVQRFDVSPAEGRAFVEASRDANPIHTEDDIVSGCMTAARLLLLPELLVTRLAVRSCKLKFRAFSHYGQPCVNRYHFQPDENGGLAIELASYQNGTVVAEGSVHAVPAAAPQGAPRHELCGASHPVRLWLESLRFSSESVFAVLGNGYPRAFLASLPPGEMVRHGGAGGLLNVLDLEFPEADVPAILPGSPPEVTLESGRPRSTFRRVLTKVGTGMVTYCRGTATVLLNFLKGEAAAVAVEPPGAPA